VTHSLGEATQPPCRTCHKYGRRHPKAHSWMEDDHKHSKREGGQLPRAGLMAASTINCRRMTLGTGGGCAVISAPWIIIQLDHGIHHFASVLCLFALLGNLALVLSDFLWPHSHISPASRLYHAKRERKTQARSLLVLSRCKAEMPAQFGEGFIHSSDSTNHAATYASNGLHGGGIPGGTNSGSTRVPPLHGPGCPRQPQHQHCCYRSSDDHGRHHLHCSGGTPHNRLPD
jgi:hypothetical protein